MNKFKGIIEKPWGNEEIIYLDKEVVIWRLFIKKGESTSLHYHPNKKTMLILLSGMVRCCIGYVDYILMPLETIHIPKCITHSTEALIDSKLIEIDSPPLLEDIVRIEDKYGRAGKPYFAEGK